MLMPSQKAEVFALVNRGGLDPSEFAWEQRGEISRLAHVRSRYFYLFDMTLAGSHYCGRYAPGETVMQVAEKTACSWPLELQRVERWLGYLKRELGAPTPWEDLARRAASIPSLGSTDSHENAGFTHEEAETLRSELDEIRREVKAAHAFNREQAAKVDARFDYLQVALDRLGRFDWRNALLGAFMSLAVDIGMPEVLGFVGRILGGPVATSGHLPSGDLV